MADRIKSLREKAMRLPLQPGVYIMKDKSDHVIYVGKAKALKIESVNILVRRKITMKK